MKLAYTILYVPDVSASLQFFERAFGLKRRFLHESGTYGELDTGETHSRSQRTSLAIATFLAAMFMRTPLTSPLVWRSHSSQPMSRKLTATPLPAVRASSRRLRKNPGGRLCPTSVHQTAASLNSVHQ